MIEVEPSNHKLILVSLSFSPPLFCLLFFPSFFFSLLLHLKQIYLDYRNVMSSPHASSDKKIETVGDYQIKNRIGQGSFAVVYKAQHKVKIALR